MKKLFKKAVKTLSLKKETDACKQVKACLGAHDISSLHQIPEKLQDEAFQVFGHNRRAKYLWLAAVIAVAVTAVAAVASGASMALIAMLAVIGITKTVMVIEGI